MASIGSIIKIPQLSGTISGLRNSLKGITSSTWFKSLAGGAATFFGFEWLTDGGLVNSVSGSLGVSETTGSIILIVVVALAIYLAFRYLDSKIPARPRSSGNGGGKKHKHKGGFS